MLVNVYVSRGVILFLTTTLEYNDKQLTPSQQMQTYPQHVQHEQNFPFQKSLHLDLP
jgi:hypothetical protein